MGDQMPVAARDDVVTISFAGFNRPWAAWIGDRLERRGLRVVYQRWDPAPEEPLEVLLTDLAMAPGRVVLVCSDWYFQMGPRTPTEWNQALRAVLREHPGRFHAVTVAANPLPAATAALAPLELPGLGEPEAERRLLASLSLAGVPAGPAGPRSPRFPRNVPDVWGGIRRRNIRFTGRERFLNDAYGFFSRAAPGAGVLTFHGMPGVGKTQLAAEYVYRFGSEYDVVWWVDAGSVPTYRQQLARLAGALRLPTGQGYGERLRAVMEALRKGQPYDRWLVILDGADEPEGLKNLLPSGSGHLLITSRNNQWAHHNSELMEVPVYDRVESVSFIRRRAPRITDEDADLLAEALGDLPLVLDQTAAWLSDSEMSVPDYLDLLRRGIDDDVLRVSDDFPLAFPTAWSLLINNLREKLPESVALLRLCTCFAPGHIPVGLLQGLRRQDVPEQIRGLLTDRVLWNRALAQLRQYSVISLESPDRDDGARESVYLHRMVHGIVHLNMSDADHEAFCEVARKALAAADPRRPDESSSWSQYATITPHLVQSDALRSPAPEVQELVLNCLRYLYRSGEYTEGIQLAERTLEAWHDLLGPEHERLWDLNHHYTNLLRGAGDYARTEQLNRRIVERLRDQRGSDDLDHLRAAGGLAADLRGLGRYQEALEVSVWVRDAYRRVLGEDDLLTVTALHNVGVSQRLLGRFHDALATQRATTEAYRRLLDETHLSILHSQTVEAEVLRFLGRYGEAESLQNDNLQRFALARVEEDHTWRLTAELNLALIHYRNGRIREAGQEIASVVERAERKLGERNPDTNRFLNSLAVYTREHGDIDEARTLSERVVNAYETRLGPGHPYSAGTRSNLAIVLRNLGERRQAYETAEEALVAMTSAVGELHPWTLGCAINASALRNFIGEYESAVELSEVTATRAAEVLGRTHPMALSARIAYADDLRGMRKWARAAKEEEAAVTDLSETLGRSHPHTVSARNQNRPYWDFEPQIT
ncbi:FxSxx-COOH system tetratricopeptide repeat protein [Streptomyces abyssomicinicus]|uniref:FxSxx-COOH system tetratricopeptide repeat protein n=1 Tax=Streptomyces abyssomicinicus TaxID=574929 RepID=UPI00124F966E|nr:FxSxx-COOH system tetratricopeptide repeat protein [Streptomyces abyssomicinicus]